MATSFLNQVSGQVCRNTAPKRCHTVRAKYLIIPTSYINVKTSSICVRDEMQTVNMSSQCDQHSYCANSYYLKRIVLNKKNIYFKKSPPDLKHQSLSSSKWFKFVPKLRSSTSKSSLSWEMSDVLIHWKKIKI